MVWFTGTSTGNKYTVGAIYQRSGEKYRANVDGSFTKLSTGKVSVGSSQSKKVQWGGFSSSPARSSSGRPSPTHGVGAAVVGASSPSVGVGAVGSRSLPAIVDGVMVTIPVTSIDPAEGLAVELGKSTRTPIQIGGGFVTLDSGVSDGGDFEQRYGEFGGSVAGLFVAGADAWSHITRSPQAEGDIVRAEQIKRGIADLKRVNGVRDPAPENWFGFKQTGGLGGAGW